ncbi:MAG: hypothetical protein NWE95_05635 [Candidatus Bathyarchaeota archaeon]|jgi:hypothetical protein|nr:hypothetical protein [Candidatus Bathyarchaeota archaeon]
MGDNSVIREGIVADENGFVGLLQDNYLAFIGNDGLLYSFTVDKLKCVHNIAFSYDKCKFGNSAKISIQPNGEENA